MKVKNFVLLMMAAFAVAWIFVPIESQGYDLGCFQSWTIFIRTKGLGRAYEVPSLDYNPLFLELLWVFGRFKGSVEALNGSFFTFKIFVLLFDFGAVSLMAYMLRRKGQNIALACFLLFNPAYLYNTMVWGQVDSIFSLFVALSIFLATRKNVLASLLCVLLAVNLKLVAVVFVPLVVLLNLPTIREHPRVLLRTIPPLLAIQLLIFLPFLNRQSLHAILAANQRQLQASSASSPSGFNFWWIVLGDQPYTVPGATTFLHVSFKTWGVVMFAVSVAVILAPLFKTVVLQKTPLDDAYVFLASSLYGLAFYFFTTGMHERYSHPAILLLAIYAVLSGSYFTYLLASLALFLNVEKVNLYFHVATHDTLIFKGAFIGKLFLVVLVVGTAKLYLELKAATRAARSNESQGMLGTAS
jgi:Gpi18-like mannosyltransferase